MLKAFKTELDLTPEQYQKLKQDCGTLRWASNHYQEAIEENYKTGNGFIYASQYYTILKKQTIPNDNSLEWVNNTHSRPFRKPYVIRRRLTNDSLMARLASRSSRRKELTSARTTSSGTPLRP